MDERASNASRRAERKRDGVGYTPAPIAHFLTDRTIALTLDERRAALAAEHGGRETPAFWRDWLEALRCFTIIDPACGDGALLVAAATKWRDAMRRFTLGATNALDAARETIVHNLYGVDIDARAVEAARRALGSMSAVAATASPTARGDEATPDREPSARSRPTVRERHLRAGD